MTRVRRHAIVAVLACAALVSTACAQPPAKADAEATLPADSGDPPPADVAGPPADRVARVMGAGFPLALYRQLRDRPGNLALSPASVTTALAMTWAGARGETARQMRQLLGFGLPDDEVHRVVGGVLARWNALDRGPYELRVANRLFGETTYTFVDGFLRLTESAYGARLEPCDFRSGPDACRSRINAWVAEQTRDRIENLLPPGSVDRDMRLVLVNAIYFKGSWETKFDDELTRPEPFRRPGAEPVETPMMHRVGQYAYAGLPEAALLELPYEGGELSMVVLLPPEGETLAGLEGRLDEESLGRWLGQLRPGEVRVAMPRFEIDPAGPLQLSSALRAMGMKAAFDPEQADFTGIADPPDPADRLCVQKVFHKAFVLVSEEGTEAAGATAVGMVRATAAPAEPTEFRVDRPFLFLIRDRRNGVLLFLGRVEDPTAG